VWLLDIYCDENAMNANTATRSESEPALFSLLLEHSRVLSLLAGSTDIAGFLKQTVEMVALRLDAGVCSIYLYEEASDELVMRATVGLKQTAVNVVRLSKGQGLVGAAFATRKVINAQDASSDPRYTRIQSIDEELYENFLAIPIYRGAESIGVLVTQRPEPKPFSEDEVVVLQLLTSHLVGAIESARVMLEVRDEAPRTTTGTAAIVPSQAEGRSVFPGAVYGPARVVGRESAADAVHRMAREDGFGGMQELNRAMAATREQLSHSQRRLADRLPEAVSLVVDAQLLMLADEALAQRYRKSMDEGVAASTAFARAIQHYMVILARSSHVYMREKVQDVADLGIRVLRNMESTTAYRSVDLSGEIVVAGDLLPSDVLMVAAENVAGVVLVSGGITAHVSLLIRSLRIPMVLCDDQNLMQLTDGDQVLLDADEGCFYVKPGDALRASFQDRLRRHSGNGANAAIAKPETHTRDGRRVHLLANINLLSDVKLALQVKAEGVGLYRTEVPFLLSSFIPTMNEQVSIYANLFENLAGHEVVVRTLDVGGDKMLGQYDDAGEANPALGLRSTRFTLHHKEIFDDQLEAVIRAAHGRSKLKLMFPMISSVDEFLLARDRVLVCRDRVQKHMKEDIVMPKIGMMLEVPSAVEMIDCFIPHSDFFSIGTNDLVQYLLAVDRTNAKVAAYYCEHHPAVLRTLARVCRFLSAENSDFSVCGEMAHAAKYIPFFIGIGVTQLSLDASFVAEVQAIVQRVTVPDAEAYVDELLNAESISATDEIIARRKSLYSLV
jgi:phosphotransferase system enzyme I (PtsP)